MDTAIIDKPVYHGKTKKMAEVVANSLNAELLDLKDFNPIIMEKYDLIGFDYGIYWFKPHKMLKKFIEELENVENKKVFILSTSPGRLAINEKMC